LLDRAARAAVRAGDRVAHDRRQLRGEVGRVDERRGAGAVDREVVAAEVGADVEVRERAVELPAADVGEQLVAGENDTALRRPARERPEEGLYPALRIGREDAAPRADRSWPEITHQGEQHVAGREV